MKKSIDQKALEHIWHAVPVDYYQRGVSHNILQRLWHTGKIRAVDAFIEKDEATILDVGCASGWFLSEIIKRHPHAKGSGIDVYDDAIAYGKILYPHLTLKQADGHTIPFKDQSFDVVMCNEVLEHVVDPGKVLEEIKRVLKKDGVGIIEMDTGNWLFRSVWYIWTHVLHGVWEDAHIQVYTEKILKQQILDAGFIITKQREFNIGMAVVFQIKKQN